MKRISFAQQWARDRFQVIGRLASCKSNFRQIGSYHKLFRKDDMKKFSKIDTLLTELQLSVQESTAKDYILVESRTKGM